jgi:hypothetical protein
MPLCISQSVDTLVLKTVAQQPIRSNYFNGIQINPPGFQRNCGHFAYGETMTFLALIPTFISADFMLKFCEGKVTFSNLDSETNFCTVIITKIIFFVFSARAKMV